MMVVVMIPAIVVIVIAVRAVMMMVTMPPTVMVMVIRSSVPDRLACRQWVKNCRPGKVRFWAKADLDIPRQRTGECSALGTTRRLDVLWLQVNTQLGALPFPLRAQRLEQIIEL